ncbi:MAG: NusA-like transcription termination signal-binding factor [archaeon]|nr:NusA-like transcription termination signal-binding factor [archaeon]
MKPLDTQVLRDIVQFEKLSKTRVVDSIFDGDILYLVVQTNNIYSIIGKNGENIKRLSDMLGKSLKVYAYSEDVYKFATNLFLRKAKRIDVFEEDGQKIMKVWIPYKDKMFLSGKKGKNIKIINEFLKRKFNIKKIDVVDIR